MVETTEGPPQTPFVATFASIHSFHPTVVFESTMPTPSPHYLLFSESRRDHAQCNPSVAQWRFVLEAVDGSSKMEVQDKEPQLVSGERLDLLAVVRGLEALDQPSRVTLVTPSRYVSRGFRHGLQDWRENGFQWERFGQMAPIKNGDLWKRIDRALRFHQVECRTWRFDTAEHEPTTCQSEPDDSNADEAGEADSTTTWSRFLKKMRGVGTWFSRRRRCAVPKPHFRPKTEQNAPKSEAANEQGHFTNRV